MAVVNYAASVQGVALRVSRLDAQGNPMTGDENVYVTRAFMRVSFTPEYEEGDEITEKNAAGEVCVTYKAPDTLKRATMELAICDPDPELTELLSGGVLLKYGEEGTPPGPPTDYPPTNAEYPGRTVGYASVKVGEAPNPNGVGIEVWSLAIREGARDNELPYYRWVFPKATLRPSGDRVIENGLLANTFEGWSVGNINFGTGPADDWYWPDATDRPFLYARDYTNPYSGVNGWVNYSPAVSDPGAKPENADGTPNAEYGVTQSPTGAGAPTGPTPYYLYYAENPDGTGATGLAAPQGTRGTGGPSGPPKPTANQPTTAANPLAGPARNVTTPPAPGGNGGNGGPTGGPAAPKSESE